MVATFSTWSRGITIWWRGSDPTAVTPTFVVDRAGEYVVQLIVNDGFVNSAPDTVVITTTNSAPVANAGPDQTVTTGSTAQLNGSGSSDVDGQPLTWQVGRAIVLERYQVPEEVRQRSRQRTRRARRDQRAERQQERRSGPVQ